MQCQTITDWYRHYALALAFPYPACFQFLICLINSSIKIWAATCDFQQCGILTCVESDEHVQPPFKLRNSKWCSASSSIFIEFSSDKQRLWSVCAYAQAGLSLCWSHIPHCWKSHATAQLFSSIKLRFHFSAQGFDIRHVSHVMQKQNKIQKPSKLRRHLHNNEFADQQYQF